MGDVRFTTVPKPFINLLHDQRRYSSRLSTVMFHGTPCIRKLTWFLKKCLIFQFPPLFLQDKSTRDFDWATNQYISYILLKNQTGHSNTVTVPVNHGKE